MVPCHHGGVPPLDELSWSDDVAQAGWIAEQLDPSGANTTTSVVPSGFEAYARILHPAEEPKRRGRLVRWHEVAAWSGLQLNPYAQFHSVALPSEPRDVAPPWSGRGPRHGSLFPPDAAVLIDHLRLRTTTPDRCWLCLWEGSDWLEGRSEDDGSSDAPKDSVPEPVREGPKVDLFDRTYLLFSGSVEDALVGRPGELPDHTASLFWPEDRAWCVASDADLSWTYVGGSAELVRTLVGEAAIEALEVSADGPAVLTEPWVENWATDAVDALFSDGHASVSTPLGKVDASLQLPPALGRGSYHHNAQSTLAGRGGVGGTTVLWIKARDDAKIREHLHSILRSDFIALVGD